MKHKNVKPFTI